MIAKLFISANAAQNMTAIKPVANPMGIPIIMINTTKEASIKSEMISILMTLSPA
jgi:hypothetical protein